MDFCYTFVVDVPLIKLMLVSNYLPVPRAKLTLTGLILVETPTEALTGWSISFASIVSGAMSALDLI